MTPLKYHQRLLELFGFCSKEPFYNDGLDIRAGFARFLIVVILFWIAFIPSAHYMYLNLDDPEILIVSLTPVVVYLLVLASYITFFIENRTATGCIMLLRTLAENRLRTDSKTFYKNAEKSSRLFTKWPLLVLCTNFSILTIIIVSHQILADWLQGDIDPNHWTLVYQLSFPFDQHTYFGFFLVNILQVIDVITYLIVSIVVIAYFLSICFYVEAICNDFQSVFTSIHFTEDDICEQIIKQKVIEVINLQIGATTSFQQMTKVVSGTIFFQIIGGTIFMSTTLFQLELAFVSIDIKMTMILFASFLAIITIFPYCYYATRITVKLQSMADIGYESQWYRWPVHLQKSIQPMIRFSQKERRVTGLGFLRCNLGGFMKIIKTAVSYYLMFKSVSYRE